MNAPNFSFLGQYMERQTLAKCEKCLANNKYDSRSETNRKPKLDSLKQNKAITPRYLQYIAV